MLNHKGRGLLWVRGLHYHLASTVQSQGQNKVQSRHLEHTCSIVHRHTVTHRQEHPLMHTQHILIRPELLPDYYLNQWLSTL